MKKLIAYFGSPQKTADALDVSRQHIYNCASEKHPMAFSVDLAKKACLLTDNITTVESLTRKRDLARAKKKQEKRIAAATEAATEAARITEDATRRLKALCGAIYVE